MRARWRARNVDGSSGDALDGGSALLEQWVRYEGFDWARRAKRIVGRSGLLAVFVVGVDLKGRDLAGEQTPILGIPIDFITEQRLDGGEFVVEGEDVVVQLLAGVVVELGGARLEFVGDVCDRAGGFGQ